MKGPIFYCHLETGIIVGFLNACMICWTKWSSVWWSIIKPLLKNLTENAQITHKPDHCVWYSNYRTIWKPSSLSSVFRWIWFSNVWHSDPIVIFQIWISSKEARFLLTKNVLKWFWVQHMYFHAGHSKFVARIWPPPIIAWARETWTRRA